MATNRPTKYAPPALTGLSKTTLADLVWELVATAPGVACDSLSDKWGEIFRAAGRVSASPSDLRTIKQAKDKVK